jgi:ankyrin repeat protein
MRPPLFDVDNLFGTIELVLLRSKFTYFTLWTIFLGPKAALWDAENIGFFSPLEEEDRKMLEKGYKGEQAQTSTPLCDAESTTGKITVTLSHYMLLAAFADDAPKVRYYIWRSANVHFRNDWDKYTVWHVAAKIGNLNIFEHCQDEATTFDVYDKQRETPLHEAVRYHDNLINPLWLLAHGVSLEKADDDSHTALLAIKWNKFAIVDFMLKKGSKLESEKMSRAETLQLAVKKFSVQIVRLPIPPDAILLQQTNMETLLNSAIF